jgi:hypothetical protein
MKLGAAIVIAAALIAAAIAASNRYAISAHRVGCNNDNSACSGAWRVDQWTGSMQFCEHGNFAMCVPVSLRETR